MKSMNTIYTGLLVLGLLCLSGIAAAQENTGVNASETLLAGDIEPYNGPIGADSPLYGLKIALENMDESFTANETERINKEMDHARLRLSELLRALEQNKSETVQEVIDNYLAKVNLTNVTISRWSSNGTGLLHAQEMIVRHQTVLEHLLETHPDNRGLQRAYGNSLALENRFMERTAVRFQFAPGTDNKTMLRTVRFEQMEQNRTHLSDTGTNVTTTQTEENLKEWEKNQNKKPSTTMIQQQGPRTQPPATTTKVQQTEQEQNRNINPGSGTPEPVTTQQQGQQQGQNQQQGGGDNGKGDSRGR